MTLMNCFVIPVVKTANKNIIMEDIRLIVL